MVAVSQQSKIHSRNTMKTLEQIFTEIFPDSGPAQDMKYQDTLGWDSLQHMILCANIEENFDIVLEINDVAAVSSYTAAQEIVDRYLKNA